MSLGVPWPSPLIPPLYDHDGIEWCNELMMQVGCRRVSTEEGVSTLPARSGVTAHLATQVTGVRRTLMSVRQIRVKTKARVLTTEDDLPVSVWTVCAYLFIWIRQMAAQQYCIILYIILYDKCVNAQMGTCLHVRNTLAQLSALYTESPTLRDTMHSVTDRQTDRQTARRTTWWCQ